MKALSKIRTSGWVTLVMASFFISASFGYRYVKEEGVKVKRLQNLLSGLDALSLSTETQLSDLNQSLTQPVVPLESLFSIWFEQDVLEASGDSVSALPSGFRHHQITLTLSEFPESELKTLLEALENTTPAWRVTGLDLRPENGSLSGLLTLEALDKSPDAL